MRSAIIGFVLGGGVVFLALIIFQRWVIRIAADDVGYHFQNYVFSDATFPWGFVDQGRVINRCLFPVNIATTFYDSQYNVVTRADKPGRYGAVVRISLSGHVVYRFITLFRSPQKCFWSDGPIKVFAELPSGTGVDAAVLRNQAAQIGDLINHGFCGDAAETPNIAIMLAGLFETAPDAPPAVDRNDARARDAIWWAGLRKRLNLPETYPYFVDLPKGYDADPAKKWPLILYLHSGMERGKDLQIVRDSGLPKAIAAGRQVPAVVVAPQMAWSGEWSTPVLSDLLDEVSAKYRIDPDRIYVTGASVGGDGTWDLALAFPERIAAIAPIAGESDPADGARIKDMPIWAFVGLKDETVQPTETTDMVDAVRKAGGHPHLTAFPNSGHNCWDDVYATDSFYNWLLAQKLGQPEALTPGLPTP